MAHFAKDLICKVFIKQPNSHERARAEEIEAKFFFFPSLLCPIFFLFLSNLHFAGLLRPLETVSKTSHKFDVNVFNNRKIH